jgi:hypothetical protein
MPCPSHQERSQHGRPRRGPPTTKFRTVDAETLDYNVHELEAAQRFGRVYEFMREFRHDDVATFVNDAQQLLREIETYVTMLEIRKRQTGSWAGMIVTLG